MHVRHANRYVRHSIVTMVETFIADHGWLVPPVLFGAKPVEVHARAPKEAELKPTAGNMVFVSFGPQEAQVVMQLGGGLVRAENIVFIDVLGENDTIALAIASDLQDRLNGALGGTRYLRPSNPATGLDLPGYVGEFTEVFLEQPREALASWQSIKAAFQLDFPGSDE